MAENQIMRYVQSGRAPLENVDLNKIHAISTGPFKPPAPKGFDLGVFETQNVWFDQLAAQLSTLTSQVSALTNENAALKTEQEKMKSDQKSEHDKLKSKHDKLKSEHDKQVNEQRKKMAEQELKMNEQRKKMAEQELKIQKLNESTKIANLEKLGLASLKTTITEVRRENSSLKDEVKHLGEKVAKLEVLNAQKSLKLKGLGRAGS